MISIPKTHCPQPPGGPFDGKKRVIVLEEDLNCIERENQQLKAAAGFCEKHKPNGGSRNCLVCACEKLTSVLDRISYECGTPNEHGLSEYGNHYDEDIVVKQVLALKAELKVCAEALLETKAYNMNGLNLRNKALSQPITKSLLE